MMQRTANENAGCLRKICKRSDQPKIERLVNNDARLILRRKLNSVTVVFLLHGVFAFTGEVTLHICHAVDFGTVRRFQGRGLTSDFVVSAQFYRCYSAGFKLLKAALQFERRYDKAFSWPAMSCDWLGCLHVVL